MTKTYTPAQLEAWAGIDTKRLIDRLAGIETPQMKGDNLAVTLCNYFENPDQEEDEHGWTPDATKGYEEVMAAIREHLAPITAAPDLARLVLEKDAEIAELKAAGEDLVSLFSADVKMNGTTYYPMHSRSAFTKAIERLLEAISKDRQTMKGTSR